jgi:flagellar hook assembly protein FlgD
VIDATGRLVRTITDERALSAGSHQVFWDGIDDRGARCAPGVYALRLQSPQETVSRKIHLLR